MSSKAVLELGRRCTRLSGLARGVGGRVAAAGSEPFRPVLGLRPFVDLHEYQVFLGEVLELWHRELVELDDRLAGALGRGRELRQARGHLTGVLRRSLSAMRDSLSGVLDPQAVWLLLRPGGRLPKDAAELGVVAERLFAHLSDPALEVPPVPEGVEIDPPAMAQGFEAPMRQLGATLAELAEVEATVQHARAKKAEALERLKLFSRRVERFFMALYEVSGCLGLAKRLRKGGQGS